MLQVQGRKRVWMFPPKEHDKLYPRAQSYPALVNRERQAQVDIFHPNREKFPLFEGVEAIECRLEAGDGLIIPSNWWHEVESASPHCISVNFVSARL